MFVSIWEMTAEMRISKFDISTTVPSLRRPEAKGGVGSLVTRKLFFSLELYLYIYYNVYVYMYNIHINVHRFIHTHTQKHTISFFSNSPPSFHPPSMCPKNIDFFQSSKKCHRSLQRPPKRTPWDPDPDRSRKVPAAVGQTLSSSHGV